MKKVLSLFALLSALLALPAHAHNVAPLGNFENMPASNASGNPASVAQIKAALTASGTALGWQVVSTGANEMVATINVRKHMVATQISVTPGMYSIKYKDSANMNYDGARINPHYNNWVRNLSDSARAKLAAAH